MVEVYRLPPFFELLADVRENLTFLVGHGVKSHDAAGDRRNCRA